MIAYLKGKIIHKGSGIIILENNKIGYKVFLGEEFFNSISLDEEREIFIYQQIKEDANDLYGFRNFSDLELFELLISVSGVGPKSALGILNLAGGADIKEAILSGDSASLTKVSGIGKKTAERLVLELKTKIAKLDGGKELLNSAISFGADEIDALISLGYSLVEARLALKEVDPKIKDSGERVRAALKKMRVKS
ncbi:Holliday junction branch migration protein RuvA [Candidatus Falkowbacteria bacterium]|nr:Holliday junction branch migration protein RuvA [Candidatus Falkowbacteria bacterium]